MRQFELVEKVKAYEPNVDEDILNRAYVFAMHAHGHQKRASGDPYFSHPIEVAGILSDMKLDGASIVTALLHDTVEDTDTTLEDIQSRFGDEIRALVDGVTKLTRIELQSDATKQAENFRKLVLAMSRDIRVLLVKLADRLHNMRTLHYIQNPEKRRRIAAETLEIYAPLAERMGIHGMKEELEDIAFAQLHSDERESIIARLGFLKDRGGSDLVQRIIAEMKKTLTDAGVTCDVSGREKTPISIWRKMRRKNISFEQLSDVMAFRVQVGSTDQCYVALGIIHSRYKVVPGRFKDFISTPKPNNYQSLHTTIIGPENQRIEIQIRTQEMHDVAEKGVAAHWTYKQGGKQSEGTSYRWLRELLEILEQAEGPEDFLEHTKLEMFHDQVFCFTPRGDLIALPAGATPVDFAYAVHSEIGDRCAGAKVNGRQIALRTQLTNGDQVEIATEKNRTPSPNWEEFVVTGKAKAHIRRFIRQKQRQEFIELGRTMLQKSLKREGHALNEKSIVGVAKSFGLDSAEDIFAQIGDGTRSAQEIVRTLFPNAPVPAKDDDDTVVPISRARAKDTRKRDSIPIHGLIPGMALHFAHCCHPIPGDRIVGIVTTGKGVTIHTIDCEALEQFQDMPERWLDCSWGDVADDLRQTGRLHVSLLNEPGALGTVTTVIGRNDGNITNLRIVNRNIDFFEMLIDVEVHDLKHLTDIIAALRATPVINRVERARR